MGLHGSIEEAGLPNVLQLLALGGKSGCVAVERGTVNGTIYLDAGVVIWAEMVSKGDRLGDHLVRSGRITRDQLRQAIETLTENASHTLTEVLVGSGSIGRAELDRFVQHQVEEAVYQMFAWTKGQFSYTPGTRPPRHATLVSLPAERLLLEAGRRADDWILIRQVIPSFENVYRRAALRGATPMETLSAEQHRILPLLDGTRNVNGLIELSGLSEFEVGMALYQLIAAGAAQLTERRPSAQHFEDAELEAYAMKTGDFNDAERRKDAARHIADCNLCAGRLRQFQARRTQEKPAATRPAAAPPPAPRPTQAPATPPAPKPPMPKSPVPPQPATPAVADARMSKDLVWLTSPQEADEIRRTQQRTAVPSPPAPPPAKPPAPPAPPAPLPPAPAAPAAPKAGITTPLRIAPKVPPPKAPPPPPSPAAVKRASATVPVPSPAPVDPAPPRRKTAVWAAVAVAAAIVIAGGGFLALRPVAHPAAAPVAALPPPVAAQPAPAPIVRDSAPNEVAPSVPAVPEQTAPAPSRDSARQVASATPAATPEPAAPRRTAPARDSTPPAPTVSAGPDAELAAGGWRTIDRAEAIGALGGRIGTIPGLRIESVASSESRGRTRVRIAQIARTGQRIVLIETATADAPGGSSRATAVSVMPPLEASGESIGSASLGNLQITARSTLPPDALTPLLSRLSSTSRP